jgi:DNA-binding CsgD family transcriptional regulator
MANRTPMTGIMLGTDRKTPAQEFSSSRGRRSGRSTRSRRDLAIRKTGFRVMGEMPWGTHICVFYQTKKDLLDAAVGFFQAGLESNEFCLWVVADSISMAEARRVLSDAIPEFDTRLRDGQMELLHGRDWYLRGHQFDLKRTISGWNEKLNTALAMGYDGMRISGDVYWIQAGYWAEYFAYEKELDEGLAGQKMLVLCTFSLRASGAVDHLLDIASAHQYSIVRRKGEWEFLESPELLHRGLEGAHLHGARRIPAKAFPGHHALTPRERVVLAQIVRGHSNREAARILGVSPRTVEFHRGNIMKKLGAKNSADLVRKALEG